MPVLVDVNEPSQLPPQPHQSTLQQQQQQQEQEEEQQRVLCSTRRQPLVDIENTETLTGKEETVAVSVSVSASDPDSKENCPPTPLPAPKSRKRSRSVVVKGVDSMSVQARSSESDTPSKCGATGDKAVEAGVEGKVRTSKVKGERRDISKETSRIDVVDSTRGDGVTTAAVIAAAASSDSSTAATADMYRKPDISYSHLILHAISQSPNEQLTLREIYAWIEARHPFYRDTPTGWQNSIRHNLSSSKAFVKLERAKNDTNKGCFWTLHESAQEILAASSSKKGRKSLVDQDDGVPALSPPSPSSTTAVRSRNASSSLPKLNCRQDGSRADLPSPAASEPYDDPKSPRPLRTKAKDVYAPSTPPSSPDYEADLEDKGAVLGNKNGRAPLASTTDDASSAIHPLETKTSMSPSSETVPSSTRRVRRPPQNLSEFVSSEDFKASFGKESSSTVPNTPLSPKPVERKRSKARPAVITRDRGASFERDLAKDPSSPFGASMSQPLPATPTEELSALALGPSLSQELPEVPLHCLVSVPLSSLSHMTQLKRSRDDMLPGTSTKKWRREDQYQQRRRDYQRGRSNSLQETTYERRGREGKREIVVASEDDWSDSDDDLLCSNNLDGYRQGMSSSSCSTNGNLLLLDSSTITYGFEMTDAEYILDFNQGPLFNSVVWPEYSNVQGLDVPTND
ncbi:transcription factor [Mortierella sp. 14UC]|nr:transcription factor [Mortierella sp. 14UC]